MEGGRDQQTNGPVAPRPPAEWSGALASRPAVRRLPWIALTLVFILTTGAMGFFYAGANNRLNDTKGTLAHVRTDLAWTQKHVANLDAKLSSTSSQVKSLQSDLKDSQRESSGLRTDLKKAEICLKGFRDMFSATTNAQVFQILLRINDECRSAYTAVQDNLPG